MKIIGSQRIENPFRHSHLRQGQFVPTAAQTAVMLREEELADPSRMIKMYEQRGKLKAAVADALPIETELSTELKKSLARVEKRIAWYEETPTLQLPMIDPSFLAWKNRSGFPAFSVFEVSHDSMTIDFTLKWGIDSFVSTAPEYPAIVGNHYIDDSLKLSLAEYCREHSLSSVKLTAKYGGAMPEEVRQKIRFWLKVDFTMRFEHMFIVAEAPDEKWKVTGIPKKDPLVIGIRRGLCWLIAAYDLTPTENFVTQLFTNCQRTSN